MSDRLDEIKAKLDVDLSADWMMYEAAVDYIPDLLAGGDKYVEIPGVDAEALLRLVERVSDEDVGWLVERVEQLETELQAKRAAHDTTMRQLWDALLPCYPSYKGHIVELALEVRDLLSGSRKDVDVLSGALRGAISALRRHGIHRHADSAEEMLRSVS